MSSGEASPLPTDQDPEFSPGPLKAWPESTPSPLRRLVVLGNVLGQDSEHDPVSKSINHEN
jgi:hypothetical protein